MKKISKKVVALKNERLYQNVVITLSDGRCGVFTGRMLVGVHEEFGATKISNIQFTEPKELPDDVHFESME